MKRLFFICILLMAVQGCAGGGLLLSQGLNTLRGGHGDVYLIEKPGSLRFYQGMHFHGIENSIARNIRENDVRAINHELKTALRKAGMLQSNGRMALLSGYIVHMENNALEKVLVVRVHLTDMHTGDKILSANVTGRAEGLVNMDAVIEGFITTTIEMLNDDRQG